MSACAPGCSVGGLALTSVTERPPKCTAWDSRLGLILCPLFLVLPGHRAHRMYQPCFSAATPWRGPADHGWGGPSLLDLMAPVCRRRLYPVQGSLSLEGSCWRQHCVVYSSFPSLLIQVETKENDALGDGTGSQVYITPYRALLPQGHVERLTGLTSLLKDSGRASGTMARACGWPTTAAKGQGRTRVRTRAQASVSNGLELAPITFCSLSLSKVLRPPAPSSVQQGGDGGGDVIEGGDSDRLSPLGQARPCRDPGLWKAAPKCWKRLTTTVTALVESGPPSPFPRQARRRPTGC